MIKRISNILFLFLIALRASADIGFYETEPNDLPEDFHPISGEITLYGNMVGQDQDGFLWTVTDNDARDRWSLTLNGEPGALTIAQVIKLEYAENGVDLVGTRTLFKMGTRDGVTPSIHKHLLFEPGEYVIGLAQVGAGQGEQTGVAFRPPMGSLSFGESESEDIGGNLDESGTTAPTGDPLPPNEEPGAYRLVIESSRSITHQPSPEGRESKETAHPVRTRSTFSTFDTSETAWYKIEFSEQDAGTRWDLHIQAPIGREMHARLVDAEGVELLSGRVDDKGKLRFPDLVPEAGNIWYVELTMPDPGFIHVLWSEPVGARIAGEEAEPNNTDEFANRVEFANPVTGRIGGDDSIDYFVFTADENTSDELRTLRVETQPPSRVLLCLQTAEWLGANQCRQGEGSSLIPDLSLAPGEWVISLSGASQEASYTLSLDNQGPVQAGVEVEPNDRIEFAKGMPEKLRIKGRFSGDDPDFYEFMVSEEPQLWRFQVIGDEIFELGYYDGSKAQKDMVRAKAGQRRVRLENIFLLPGRHYIRVQGRDGGEYTLLARALGPPDPNGEMEPNDQFNKQRLSIGQTRTGLSGDESDQDYYRFFVANWDHLRLTFTPPVDGMVAPSIYWYDQIIGQGQPDTPGEAMVMQGHFPPGDYHVVLQPRQVSDAQYTISLERMPRFSCPSDCEPNGQGQIWLASPLPPDLIIQGEAGQWRDRDIYQLPAFEQPAQLHITTPDPVRLKLGTSPSNSEWLQHDTEFGGFKTQVPGGKPYRLIVEAQGSPYRLQLAFPNGEIEPVIESLPVELELELEERSVSAYRLHGQRFGGALKLRNLDPAAVEVRLEAVTSDHRWRVSLDTESITIPPAGVNSVDLEVLVASDAWAFEPVRISARAVDQSGRQAQAWQDVTVERELPAVNPELYWAIPESLRGGLNAAWSPFGSEWTSDNPDWATRTDVIRDGLVFDGSRLESGYLKEGEYFELTIDLPGDDLLPVAGTAIDHFGYPSPFFDAREAAFLLSEDGVTFAEVLRFETLPIKTEQQFALPEAVPARFARLRIDSTFGDSSALRLFMSEWKIILEPGYDLSSGAGYNIADPAFGGHLVWDWPPRPYAPHTVLTPDDVSQVAHTRGGSTKDYVIGFLQNRAAQITGIDWLYADNATQDRRNFNRIEAAISLESPVGPWLPLGELSIDETDSSGKLELSMPSWARFVRLKAHIKEGENSAFEPGHILIHERPQSDEYLSVLGEWGTLRHRAFYELQQGLQEKPPLLAAENTSRPSAANLQPDKPVAGEVSLGKQEHWYRMSVPEGQNTLTIAMIGDPTVRTVVELQDSAGERIPLRRIHLKMAPDRHEFEAVVEPGSEVYFNVFEPPRNVAFSWDTSASVNAYIPMINNAIIAFSSQVVPGQEAVNLFPFPTGPLLDEWLGEPYMLQTILNDYRRPSSSSAAEVTLKYATQALAPLPGTKAIVVITDGDVNHDGDMWGEYQTTQPRVFSVQVAGAERLHQSLMHDWADVNGGHYSQLRYDGEMEVAFDRATTLMHRPAGYTLLVESEFREAPGPGLLNVVAGEGSGSGVNAVELILDASGSMLQRIDGKRRINIAKEVLSQAVQEHIPTGTPVALRVFGHMEVDSCRTDLEIPLGPLDPAAATAKIASINAMNLARTPIADSLRAVPGDLQGSPGGVVVLVTDGEETCEGDPGAVIDTLRDKGFDVNLNIVGFAIDDAELAAQFESWAELGSGRYFSANDQGGLSESIEQALRVPFTVYDQAGNEVAIGQVGGEPVELERGIYRVVVSTSPKQTFDAVEIEGEDSIKLELR